jgi:hypothetical protein
VTAVEAPPSGGAVLPCGCPLSYREDFSNHQDGCRFFCPQYLGVPKPHPLGSVMVGPHTLWLPDDGGRAAAGYRGHTGDCGARALSIATGIGYQSAYDLINAYAKAERPGKRRHRSNARTGVHSATMRRLIEREFDAEWVSTMSIGSGTTVHLRADELPPGRLIVRVSKHYAAVDGGIIRDTHDPSRNGTRAVYGFWRFAHASE